MMDEFLRLFLPLYFIIYFGLAFVVKSILVAKRIGKNPLVLPRDNGAEGLVGFYFKITLIGMFIYVLAYSFFPKWYDATLPLTSIDSQLLIYLGLGLLVFALIWTLVAQRDMRDSWRIGIDTEMSTELITTGLFSVSRNPTFLGMIISLFGLFLITPNAITLIFLVLGYTLIQIEIRFEEEFFLKSRCPVYQQYQKKVRRFL